MVRLHRDPVHDGMPDFGPLAQTASNSGARFIMELVRAHA